MSETANTHTDDAVQSENDRIYTPQAGESQFTWRAVIAGCLIGSVVAMMNAYVGLRIGWSFGGSLIAAIMSFALFTMLGPKKPFGVLETNISQTAGSAAGSMTSAAGLLAAIPALAMLGQEFSFLQLVVWAFSVAYLGVCFAVPLRRQMIVADKLRFPTGTATAETIVAMNDSGGDAVRKARVLMLNAAIAGAFTFAMYFFSVIEKPLNAIPVFAGSFAATWGLTLLVSPVMLGAGILIGPRVAGSLFAGALVAWGFLGPYVKAQGWAPGKVMAYADGARGWLLWPGVALMVADALTSLGLNWRSFVNAFKRPSAPPSTSGETSASPGLSVETAAPDHTPEGQEIPTAWWVGLLAVASLATIGVEAAMFNIPVGMSILAIFMSAILAMVATRSTGETDINPIGGMGKVTQVVYGALAPGQVTTNLMTAAVTGSGASQAGDMMQDLKTGYLLGASPREQFKAQVTGIGFGIFFSVGAYKLLAKAYPVGSEKLPAPAAHAWKAMAELLSKGLDALPPHAVSAVVAAALVGAAVPVIRKFVPAAQTYLPSTLAMGIAFIVPAYYSIAMFIGMVLFQAWKRVSPDNATALAFSVASGLLVGEGVMGMVNAGMTIIGVPTVM